jgi:tRNA pseudouridine13 synthase
MSTPTFNMTEALAFAYPTTQCSALYRQKSEYFKVYETLNFIPRDEGDHLYLYIQKCNINTDWLAQELARKANINPVDVGYAGRKDRHAITSQWFSLHLPLSKSLPLSIFEGEGYSLIKHSRHDKKLRKGQITFNRFKLQLTDFVGSFEQLKERGSLLSVIGFPNYFGPQRFGHNGANVVKAEEMLSGKVRVKDRNKRSIYLSAARSYLFNKILEKRINNQCWQTPLKGDRYWDHVASELTEILEIETVLETKLKQGNLSVTGALAGDGISSVADECLALEAEVLRAEAILYKGISDSRIDWQRRSLRTFAENFICSENELGVELEFSLPTGAYATSLLRELVVIKDGH